METRIEQTILKNLIQSEEFARKCVPFIKSEYFADTDERTVFNEIHEYFQKYTKSPTVEALLKILKTILLLTRVLQKVQKL